MNKTANMTVDSWCKNRRKYEAQIAEMQNKSFILYSMLYETLEKQGCENVASQIDQMTGWTYDKEADWLKGNRNYDQLKQQLAESEKNIEHYHKLYNERDKQFQSVRQRYHLLNKLQSNYDKKDKLHLAYMQCAELVDENEQLKQQLAITEKALKLACEEIGRIEAKFGSAYIRANGYLLDYFKTKAKEMLENE